ncbi:hypothetical protein HA402_008859 [Bradysia odoriphaga]|nr:hypothetical protein HA402_008859 [Bradysia odoriphaga]
MILKSGLVITVLFGAIIADTANEDPSLYVEDVWKSSKNDLADQSKPGWVDGVQKYHDGIIEAFGNFPPGPSMDKSKAVRTKFQSYLIKLVKSSNSKSTVLSTGANAILGCLKNIDVIDKTPIGVINEFQRVLPNMMETYRGVIANVTPVIGSLTGPVIGEAMTELERSFMSYMTEFLHSGDERGFKRKIDYEPVEKRFEFLNNTISSLTKSLQNPLANGLDGLQSTIGGVHNRVARGLNFGILSKPPTIAPQIQSNTVSVIAESAINNPATGLVQDGLTVLHLAFEHITICFYGLSSCSEAVLIEQQNNVQITPDVSLR